MRALITRSTRMRSLFLTVALLAVAGLAAANRRRRFSPERRLEPSEDCAVSECAADGVPLSTYAG